MGTDGFSAAWRLTATVCCGTSTHSRNRADPKVARVVPMMCMFEGRWQGEDELGMGGRAQKSGLFAVVCGRHPSLMFFLLEVLRMMRGGLWPEHTVPPVADALLRHCGLPC